MHFALRPALLAAALAGLTCGLIAWALGAPDLAAPIWAAGTLPGLIALVWQIVASLARGEFGLDIVAALSMSAALLVGETLAAAVVALMYAGGQYLEAYADGRARREMTALLSRVPQTALRYGDQGLQSVALADIRPGDRLLIRAGDVVPADGRVAQGVAVLDQSTLTGESLPVKRQTGGSVLSGAASVGDAFDLIVQAAPADSALAAIVAMVAAAQDSRAPMTRLADRAALGFLAVCLALAGAAWALTGDPIRAVAVLVVATPCPLILAVPVALVAGLSRAAGQGILVKGGRALERLAQVRALVLDKTGTLTHGSARVARIDPVGAWAADEVLRLAAALDQASAHVVAAALVAEAAGRGLTLTPPVAARETPGDGIAGEVEGHAVLVGGATWVQGQLAAIPANAAARVSPPVPAPAGAMTVTVAIDGALAGTITLADLPRPGIAALLAALRGLGLTRIVLATGDRLEVAEAVAGDLRLDAIHAGLTPQAKVAIVQALRAHGPVMMVGDGVNDAPALAAADIGVAMGAKGAAASAQTADVVLLVDHLDRLLPAITIARRTRAIAVQSVVAGLGLSLLGMIAAALGWLSPVQGALVQEAIDVAVILNALRALGGGAAASAPGTPAAVAQGAPAAGVPGGGPARPA